jgi:hypothetical protein
MYKTVGNTLNGLTSLLIAKIKTHINIFKI